MMDSSRLELSRPQWKELRRAMGFIMLVGWLTGVAAETGPAAGRNAFLDRAFNAFLEHQGRWAYTETRYGAGPEGKAAEAQTVVRVDPSQPYPKQFTPLQVQGKPPTPKQIAEWETYAEKTAKRRIEATVSGSPVASARDSFYLQLPGQKVKPLLDEAVVSAETEACITYRLPLRKWGETEGRFEQFELEVCVSKQRPDFERVTIRQLAPLRAGAGKYWGGLTEIEFAVADPQYPAVPVKLTTATTNKPLFGKERERGNVSLRSDLRHVTPYEERLQVKLGPLRVIEF